MGQNMTREKKIPQLVDYVENCCGCAACHAICPVDAIFLESDDEGFIYPKINVVKCIQCYRCLSVCAFKQEKGI